MNRVSNQKFAKIDIRCIFQGGFEYDEDYATEIAFTNSDIIEKLDGFDPHTSNKKTIKCLVKVYPPFGSTFVSANMDNVNNPCGLHGERDFSILGWHGQYCESFH